jgi:hypothetical protein
MATIPTLAEAKKYMRVDPDYIQEDDLIQSMLDAAVSWCEEYTGLAFSQRAFSQYSEKPFFDLDFYPLVSIQSVKNVNLDSVSYSQGSTFYPKIFPAYPGVSVQYTAGYSNNLPSNLKIAILMFANTLYENREDFVISNFRTFANSIPIGVKDLLGLHTRSAGLFL